MALPFVTIAKGHKKKKGKDNEECISSRSVSLGVTLKHTKMRPSFHFFSSHSSLSDDIAWKNV